MIQSDEHSLSSYSTELLPQETQLIVIGALILHLRRVPMLICIPDIIIMQRNRREVFSMELLRKQDAHTNLMYLLYCYAIGWPGTLKRTLFNYELQHVYKVLVLMNAMCVSMAL